MSQGKDNARLKSYKNKSLNTDEMRRRREEEGLQLRKQKKDEQVSKVWRKQFRRVLVSITVEVELFSRKIEGIVTTHYRSPSNINSVDHEVMSCCYCQGIIMTPFCNGKEEIFL